MDSIELVKSAFSISASGLTAAEVVGHITSRKRNRRVDTVRRLHQVCSSGTSRQSVVNVLRQLEAGGFETFINGLRGAESRFEWREV